MGPFCQKISLLQLDVPAFQEDLALLMVEIGGERREIELGEVGALKDGVHAVHSAELPLLHLVVQKASIARSPFHSWVLTQSEEKTNEREGAERRVETRERGVSDFWE